MKAHCSRTYTNITALTASGSQSIGLYANNTGNKNGLTQIKKWSFTVSVSVFLKQRQGFVLLDSQHKQQMDPSHALPFVCGLLEEAMGGMEAGTKGPLGFD